MRFRLTAPHHLEVGPHRIPTLVEAGTVIDTADLPAHFRPSPAMEPLDDEAYAAVKAVCDAARAYQGHPHGVHGAGSVPAFGPLHHHPGGDLEERR